MQVKVVLPTALARHTDGQKSFASEAANLPESVAAIRNAMAGARLLGAVDPEMLQRLARGMEHATAEHKAERKPPSLWTLLRRSTSEDARRGLSFLTLLLASLGKATREQQREPYLVAGTIRRRKVCARMFCRRYTAVISRLRLRGALE